MKHTLKKIVFIATLFSNALALDLPNFYRAALFQGEPGNNIKDWTSYVEVKGSVGETSRGFDARGNTKNILNIHGLVDVNKLGINVKDLTLAQKPKTWDWLRETSGQIPQLNFTGNDGKLEMHGEFKTHEIVVELRQNLFSGLYAKLYVPFRRVEIKSIRYTDKTSSTNSNAASFTNFLETYLDTVLQENGLNALTVPYTKSSVGDLAVIAGWQGYGDSCFGSLLKDLTGGVEAMVTVPTASKEQLHRVVSLPIGYNNHWGLGARVNALGHIADWFAVGVNAGVNVLLTRTTRKRMITEEGQSGIILLDEGRAEVDPGTIWNLGGYLKLDKPFGGIYAIVGYSFTTQEPTRLVVKDNLFLSNIQTTENKEVIVNSDTRLKQWDQHVLHFMAGYDFKAHTESNLAPRLEFFYAYPIAGKRIFRTDMIGGRGGLVLSWKV